MNQGKSRIPRIKTSPQLMISPESDSFFKQSNEIKQKIQELNTMISPILIETNKSLISIGFHPLHISPDPSVSQETFFETINNLILEIKKSHTHSQNLESQIVEKESKINELISSSLEDAKPQGDEEKIFSEFIKRKFEVENPEDCNIIELIRAFNKRKPSNYRSSSSDPSSKAEEALHLILKKLQVSNIQSAFVCIEKLVRAAELLKESSFVMNSICETLDGWKLSGSGIVDRIQALKKEAKHSSEFKQQLFEILSVKSEKAVLEKCHIIQYFKKLFSAEEDELHVIDQVFLVVYETKDFLESVRKKLKIQEDYELKDLLKLILNSID